MTEGALTLSGDGIILYANGAATGLLSAGPEGIVGEHLRTRVRAEERDRFDAILERAREDAVHAEIRVRGQKGGRPLYLSLRPLEDRGDRLVVAVLTDLTEQKTTEAALESERLARSVFEQAGEPIIVCDKDGVVIRASRAAIRLAGRQPLFRDFDTILPLRTVDGGPFSLKENGGLKRLRAREVRYDRDDGASFSLILRASPLKTEDGEPIGRVVTLTDITGLKEAAQVRETLLRDLERANSELETIESLSHAGLELTTVDQLAHSIVSQVAMALRADEAALLLVEGDQVTLAAAVPPIGGGRRPVDVGNGFVGTIVKMGRSLFVEDAGSSRLVTPRERARGSVSLFWYRLFCRRRRHRRAVRRLEAQACRGRQPAAFP